MSEAFASSRDARAGGRGGCGSLAARLACLVLVSGVVACGRTTPDLPAPPAPLRQSGAPVGAQIDVTAARLEGEWQVVRGAGVPPGAAVRFAPGRMRIAGTDHAVEEVAPGRFTVAGRPLWVHWLDADGRTAAMGDPGGAWVFVLDRTGRPGERLAAAEEILDWYGYDLTALSPR